MRIKAYHILAIICVISYLITPDGSDSPFTYHFLHANVFHLIANILALLAFKPRVPTIIIALLVASFAYLIDFHFFHAHTIGLSAALMAMYARKYIAWKKSPLPTIYAIFILGLLPHINWHIHLLSFLLGLVVWHIYYKIKHSVDGNNGRGHN